MLGHPDTQDFGRKLKVATGYDPNTGTVTETQQITSEFYDRQGDFSEQNLALLDRQIARIIIDEGDEEPLVEFLLSLTDERVRNAQAPFDHPQLFVSNGHHGDENFIECVENGIQACDDILEVAAVGAADDLGRRTGHRERRLRTAS